MKKTFLKLGMCLFIMLLPFCVKAATTNVAHIQLLKFPAYTRVIFSINEPDHYHVFSLTNPHRVVVDLDNARLRADIKHFDLNNSHITNVRNGNPKPNTLRIVFDMDGNAHYKKFMTAVNQHEAQLVVDIFPTEKTQTVVTTKTVGKKVVTKTIHVPAPQKKAPAPTPPKKVPAAVTEITQPHPLMIVIDPGHGGKDPGTIGPHGTKEKDIVLGIGLRLADLINHDPHMHASLTRRTDQFVTLRNRLRLARQDKADIFISIHADAYQTQQSFGVSVYALSPHGASSEAARWMARQENNSELGGVDLGELSDKSYVLRSVLIDLAQTATINDSVRLGSNVLDALERVSKLHYPKVEQAPFVVLKSPDIPSILVETGYLSNSTEEEHLRDPEYREKMAKAVLAGIQQYLINHPVAGV